MQEILFGKIVDLRETERDAKDVKWQTKGMKKQIETAGIRKKGLFLPLDGEDVTKENIHLVKEFMPEIRLSGLELRSERKSKAWGGSYFRVIEETNNPDRKCIQHVFVWTKQKFFISFWVTVLPLFILGIMGTLIYSYLSYQSAVISIILIGALFFILGALQFMKAFRGIAKGVFYFSNQHLFVVFGLVMWSLLIEMFMTKPTNDVSEGAETWHPEIIGSDILEEFVLKEYSLRFSYVGAIFIIAGVLALYFWWREPPSFTHATHAMDWAPFFVYIQKKGPEWELEKVVYDSFHYYAGSQSLGDLKKTNAVSKDGKHPRFSIPNFWHSFEPKVARAPWFTVVLGLSLFVVALVLALFSFTQGDVAINATTIRFVIVPLLLFLGAYLAFSKWPTKLIDKNIDVNDNMYHITDTKLNIFWNLKGEEPSFKVRSKFQDPFMEEEHFNSFRDDLEQILLYSVLPKIRELEQLSQDDFFKKI